MDNFVLKHDELCFFENLERQQVDIANVFLSEAVVYNFLFSCRS